MPKSVGKLREQFIDCLNNPESTWLDVWEHFANDEGFHSIIRGAVARISQRRRLDEASADDLRQELLLSIGIKLRRNKSLGFDRNSDPRSFGTWLFVICLREANRLARRPETASIAAPYSDNHWQPVSAPARDLQIALEQLDPKHQSILLLLSYGYSIRELADLTGCSYWSLYRQAQAALSRARAANATTE